MQLLRWTRARTHVLATSLPRKCSLNKKKRRVNVPSRVDSTGRSQQRRRRGSSRKWTLQSLARGLGKTKNRRVSSARDLGKTKIRRLDQPRGPASDRQFN